MTHFDGFGLDDVLLASLARMKYTAPTPIQTQAIPMALEGHDIMGSAQTGTGKTGAFAIPLVNRLLTNPKGTALVLTPTRELGKQVMDVMQQLLGPKSAVKTAFLIGGEPMGKQLSQLRARPRLVVGTPGRINDHLERGSLYLKEADFLVLDETDRMLDMGFSIQLERIFKYMPEKRQTLMFSATLPKNILKMSEKYMNDPQRVSVGQVNVIAKNIKQDVIRIDQSKKYDELLTQLNAREGSVIVFVKTKHGADRIAKNLTNDGVEARALHGDLRQNKRDRVMQGFRKQKFRVLIATDIAARGLDVPHIEHVVNYDLPQVAEDFIHRMGRTARAGAQGEAVSFVAKQEADKWYAIELLLNPELAKERGNRKPEKGTSKGKNARRPRKGDAKGGKAPEKRMTSERRAPKKVNRAQDDEAQQAPKRSFRKRPERPEGKKADMQSREGVKRRDGKRDEQPKRGGGKRREQRAEGSQPESRKKSVRHTAGNKPPSRRKTVKPNAKKRTSRRNNHAA